MNHRGLDQKAAIRLRDYLEAPIIDFPWLKVYTEAENRRGLLALWELARRLESPLSLRAPLAEMRDHRYLFHLHEAKKAMDAGQYSLACHELQDVIHFYHNRQVLYNILNMLKPYLEG